MTARDEFDRRLADWMTETVSIPAPAERFEQAVQATARRRPRTRWLAAFGNDWVGTTTPRRVEWAWPGLRRELVMAVTVALLVAAFVGIQALGGPGSTPTPGPSATPVPLPPAGALAPGTYFLANPYVDDNPVRDCARGCADYQRIIFTLPAGWATSEGRVYKHLDQPGEVAFSAWTVDQVYDDPCHWQRSALSPLDLADHSHDATGIVLAPEAGGLANQLLRGAVPRALTEVTLGGETALRIDLSVPDVDLSSCDMGEFRSWTEWDVVGGANSHHARNQLDTVYEVDVDRRPLVIDASHMPATSEADLAELESILASMIIDRGEPVETPSPPATAAPPTAPPGFELPMKEVRTGRLDPGTYFYGDVDRQGFNVRFTVPAGWTWNGRYLSKGVVGPPDGAVIYFFGGPVQVYADPCHWAGAAQSTPPTGPSVDDLIAALAAQPSRSATTPIARPANVPGLANRWAGMAVELTVPDNISFGGCDGGQFRSWGPENNARSHQGPGQRDLVWAVDIGGTDTNPGGLVIDAASFPGTPADAMSEIDAILGSIAVGHWG
jgi:hypothetical protein